MDGLRSCISSTVEIDNSSLDRIEENFSPKSLKKGELFLEAGNLCREMAFVRSGFLRIYSNADGKEITLWIASNGKFITALSSFVFQTENHWSIQALTDCELLVIKREDHFSLGKEVPKWLEFDNLLLAHSFMLLERSMFNQLYTTAMQRLENLLSEEPELFHNVPHQYIASMLGIAPESLSRLRKQLKDGIS